MSKDNQRPSRRDMLLGGAAGLAAGTLVTTGTLTDAQPLVAGQTWETRFDGEALPGLALRAIE